MKILNVRNSDSSVWTQQRPHTSLLIACYNVDQYLPQFLKSLESQTADHSGYELIFIVDGSPDHSEAIIRDWMFQADYAVHLIVKPNGGVASARNAGLAAARGAWVTAPDPDDILEREYLAEVENARREFPDASMFATRLQLKSSSGSDQPHPLDFKYTNGRNRLIDLKVEPQSIQTTGGNTFMLRSIITEHGLHHDEKIAQASDGVFLTDFLLSNGAQHVVVPGAIYEYWRRTDGSSIVIKQARNVPRYKYAFGTAHRRLLDRSDECPQWLANVVLYFTYMLFRRNLLANSPVLSTSAADLAEIRTLLIHNLRRIGAERIERFAVVELPVEIRSAWLAAVGSLTESPVIRLESDDVRGHRRIGFFTAQSELPSDFSISGNVKILETKTRAVDFLGATWAFQQIVCLKGTSLRGVRLNAAGNKFSLGGKPLTEAKAREMAGQVPPGVAKMSSTRTSHPGRVSRARWSLVWRLSVGVGWHHRFADAWVFTDGRWSRGLGDAEIVFRHLQDDGLGQNAWFVADKESEAFSTLRAERFPVVPWGSWRHFVLMKRSKVYVSTQLRLLSRLPFPTNVISRTWRRVWVKPDEFGGAEYRRVNPVSIDLVSAVSDEEFRLLSDNSGKFRYLKSDVAVTGIPRRDVLVARAPTDTEDRSDLVFALRWSEDLRPFTDGGGIEFRQSNWAKFWLELLSNDQLHELDAPKFVLVPDELIHVFEGLGVPNSITPVFDPSEKLTRLAQAAVVMSDDPQKLLDAAACGAASVCYLFDRSESLGGDGSALERSFEALVGDTSAVAETVDAAILKIKTALDQPLPQAPHSIGAHPDATAASRVVKAIISLENEHGRIGA